MDYGSYTGENLPKKILLEFPGITFTGDTVQEDLTLSEAVNTGEELTIGCAASAQLEFSLLDLEGTIPDAAIQGKEFRYLAGVRTAQNSRWDDYQTCGGELFLPAGELSYTVHGGILTIWKNGARLTAPTQPPKPVQSLILVGGLLYCGHGESPWVTVYQQEGESLSIQPALELTPFEIEQVKRYNFRQAAVSRQGGQVREYEIKRKNLAPVDVLESVFDLHQVGIFLAEKPERKDDNILKVCAYDRMVLFDKVVDSWANGAAYPVPVGEYLQSLCQFVGVPLKTTSFLNDGYSLAHTYDAQGITGRQVIQWIAEIAANFAHITPDGELELAWYGQRNYTVNASRYTSVKMAEYAVDPIDKLQVKVSENDIGVIVGEGENLYIIENNPLLYTGTDAQIRPVVQKIFDAIKTVTYTPYTVHTVAGCGNPLLRAGDSITLTTRGGNAITALIMELERAGVQAVKDQYRAVGNHRRLVQSSALNSQVTQLKGKVNELTRTVEETVSRLYDTETGDISVLRQTADSLTTRVEDAEGAASQAQQTANGISTRVSNAEGDISSLEQTVSGFELAVNASKLKFDRNGLTCYKGGFRINDGSRDVFAVDTSGNIEARGTFGSYTNGETAVLKGGNLEFYWGTGSTLLGSIYTNSNTSEGLCISSTGSRPISFAAGGYLRGKIKSDGTFDNGKYNILTTGFIKADKYVKTNTIYTYNKPLVLTTSENYTSSSYYGDLACCDITSTGKITTKSLSVSGTKSCAQTTPNYGTRLVNAYETAEYYFGDIGEGKVENGECTVPIEAIFGQCVNTTAPYQVFLTPYGPGMIYVTQREESYFLVKGDNIPFAWEIKAKRKGYESTRLEKETTNDPEY